MVLCPLKKELDYLISAIEKKGFKTKQGKVGRLLVTDFPELGIKISQAGHGKTQFGIQTQFFIQHFGNINGVICAGCAGGLADEVELFDVVLAEKTIEHDYKERFSSKSQPEFPGDKKLLEKIRSEKFSGFKVRVGPIASGDEDIIDAVRVAEIKAATRALAVAWEGAGGARAAQFNNIPFLEIRGITDKADSQAAINFSANLQQAMAHVAECLVLLAR